MKKQILYKMLLWVMMMTIILSEIFPQLTMDKQWHYIQVDSSRQKWGDWAEPSWLRYFGLDMKDINKDGYQDIISGRYFYLNPGGADVIAEALPDVYWFEANDLQGSTWTCRKVGEIPQNGPCERTGRPACTSYFRR